MELERRHAAFVLGLFDTGLAVVRSLGRAGITVRGFDCDPGMPGFRSRYCTATRCPDPEREPAALLQCLRDAQHTCAAPSVLVATSDPFVAFVSRYRQELAPGFLFLLPAPDVLDALLDKRRQYELAARLGIPYPATWSPRTMEDVEAIKSQVDYPVFIKPCHSHRWTARFESKGVQADTPTALVQRLAEFLRSGTEVVVQSIVPGPNTNHVKLCAYMVEGDRPLALFALRKIRQQPTDFGIGSLVESIHDPELVELGLKFLRGIHYRGIGSIEFKRDARDGHLTLIELNTRYWQQSGLAAVAGVDFPLLQYRHLTGQQPAPQHAYAAGRTWLDPAADFVAAWTYHRRGELGFRAWLRSWLRADTYSALAWDDPVPFLASIGYGRTLLRLPRYVWRHRRT